jgi:NAD(P)-dependent dehydrogenase (short-subunit alcohol dehydrogenase family)
MQLAMFDLSGRVALVTGGNSGIGLGYARGIAKAGAKLAIWGRDETKNAEAVAELAALGAEAAGFACDVASEPQVVEGTRATLARFGRIDACFANAGFGTAAPFLETTLEDWNRVLQVNLTGAFLTFREVAKHMVARGGGGKLIATSSIGEICGMPKQEAYAATKAALSSLVRALAVELARHDIQANAILPGWIETPATAPIQRWKALNEAVLHRTPARRWGRPEDLEGVAVYLASDASRFHTGDVLRVDGGYMVF